MSNTDKVFDFDGDDITDIVNSGSSFSERKALAEKMINDNQTRFDKVLVPHTEVIRSEDNRLAIILNWGQCSHNAETKDIPICSLPNSIYDKTEHLYWKVSVSVVYDDKIEQFDSACAWDAVYEDGSRHWEYDREGDNLLDERLFNVLKSLGFEGTEIDEDKISFVGENKGITEDKVKDAFFWKHNILIEREGGGEPLLFKLPDFRKARSNVW